MERSTNHTGRSGPSGDPVYLVMERDPLVADDIAGSLMHIGPCRVIQASDSSDMAELLRDETMISAAFLDIRYKKVVEDRLDESLNAHGARIILTVGEDDHTDALARGWGMLIRPFTEDMIRELVAPRPPV